MDISICCITYNHALYIEKMLDSVLEQKTNYTYEILIHDDASTDGTTDIVRKYAKKYPDKIRTILQRENQFSQGKTNILFDQLFPLAEGEYIAICEGDDYWCCLQKLDRQINFMKQHPKCSVCTHQTRIVTEDGGITQKSIPMHSMPTVINGEEYLRECLEKDSHLFHTSSIFFRRHYLKMIQGHVPEFISQSPVEDRALFWFLATKGDVGYLKEEMSCYRTMSVGSWTREMEASRQKKYYKNISLLNMVRLFNEYTGYEFANEIYNYETNYLFVLYEYELNCKEMLKPRFRNQWESLNIREKIFFGICAFFPQIGIWYRKIKWKDKK